MNPREQAERVTSLTIDNLPVWAVGVVLEVLREGGLAVEVNIGNEPRLAS